MPGGIAGMALRKRPQADLPSRLIAQLPKPLLDVAKRQIEELRAGLRQSIPDAERLAPSPLPQEKASQKERGLGTMGIKRQGRLPVRRTGAQISRGPGDFPLLRPQRRQRLRARRLAALQPPLLD